MKIPRLPENCSSCILKRVCHLHPIKNGIAQEYFGYGAYDSSKWIQSVLDQRFYKSPHSNAKGQQMIVEIFAYDPRTGFWYREIEFIDGTATIIENGKMSDISERAIDQTFHRLNVEK